MPASERRITPDDIIALETFGSQRAERRRALLPRKKLRRIDVGPVCTFYFETYDTMHFQIQEMLLVEKGGNAQLKDELLAYNPMIPQGSELSATIMFEIDNPIRRAEILGSIGGVEDRFYIQIGDERIFGTPEGDIERTDETGKASSVHFVKFALSEANKADFRGGERKVQVGVDHARYGHASSLSPESRSELATDLD